MPMVFVMSLGVWLYGRSAINYNLEATEDNGSCVYAILGCTDPAADNFDPVANTDDGSCTFCTNFQALLVANSDVSESGASDGYIQAGQGIIELRRSSI